jgi:hypothetical protein
MRTILLLTCLLGGLAADAQTFYPHGFWDALPDSIHQTRFLKNWKLKGPVKQVVVKTFEISYRHSDKPATWDTLSEQYLEVVEGYGAYEPLKFDTIRFNTNGEVALIATHTSNHRDLECFDNEHKVHFTDAGNIKMIVGPYNDTVLYSYDDKGRLISIKEFTDEFVDLGNELFTYPDANTQIYYTQLMMQRYPKRHYSYHYNDKGQLVLFREYQDAVMAAVHDKGFPIFEDSMITEHVYAYDEAGRLKLELEITPEWLNIGYEGNDSIISFKDTATTNYKYNAKGLLIEAQVQGTDNGKAYYIDWFSENPTNKEENIDTWITKYQYDMNGWVTEMTEYNMDQKIAKLHKLNSRKLTYQYDSYGNPTKIMSQRVTYKEYDWETQTELSEIEFIHYQYYK